MKFIHLSIFLLTISLSIEEDKLINDEKNETESSIFDMAYNFYCGLNSSNLNYSHCIETLNTSKTSIIDIILNLQKDLSSNKSMTSSIFFNGLQFLYIPRIFENCKLIEIFQNTIDPFLSEDKVGKLGDKIANNSLNIANALNKVKSDILTGPFQSLSLLLHEIFDYNFTNAKVTSCSGN